MRDNPLVSVAMVTYNHRDFIAQALHSVLAQHRDFPIEIVIGDDCSPDGTGRIIDEYQARYPDLFVRCDPERNVGGVANMSRVWASCRGKYIAQLEGDDWWHSPDKLATQVAFMDRHPDCTVSGHMARVVRTVADQTVEVPSWYGPQPEWSDARALIAQCFVPTASGMFRRGILPTRPPWVEEIVSVDLAMFLLHALHGRIGFINEPLCTYRLHPGGLWTSKGYWEQHEQNVKSFRTMRSKFPSSWRRSFDEKLAEFEHTAFLALRSQGRYGAARRHLWSAVGLSLRSGYLSFKLVALAPFWLLYPGFGLGSDAAMVPAGHTDRGGSV